jgi:hypothetical protein
VQAVLGGNEPEDLGTVEQALEQVVAELRELAVLAARLEQALLDEVDHVRDDTSELLGILDDPREPHGLGNCLVSGVVDGQYPAPDVLVGHVVGLDHDIPGLARLGQIVVASKLAPEQIRVVR